MGWGQVTYMVRPLVVIVGGAPSSRAIGMLKCRSSSVTCCAVQQPLHQMLTRTAEVRLMADCVSSEVNVHCFRSPELKLSNGQYRRIGCTRISGHLRAVTENAGLVGEWSERANDLAA